MKNVNIFRIQVCLKLYIKSQMSNLRSQRSCKVELQVKLVCLPNLVYVKWYVASINTENTKGLHHITVWVTLHFAKHKYNITSLFYIYGAGVDHIIITYESDVNWQNIPRAEHWQTQ